MFLLLESELKSQTQLLNLDVPFRIYNFLYMGVAQGDANGLAIMKVAFFLCG